MTIILCPSCEGYGWFESDQSTCDWCERMGYVYQHADGSQSAIPNADYPRVADQLEALEHERMRKLGYTGVAKPPWEQAIRQKKSRK